MSGTLTVYSGRSESLVGALLEQFETATGVDLEVRYGDTAELASTILEEGDNSPADVFFAQDAGALGAVAARLAKLPRDVLDRVTPRYSSPDGVWAGTSARARVLVFNTEKLRPDALPASILDLTDGKWKRKVGWAPTNGSFQAFVTAFRLLKGDEAARSWLRAMQANDPRTYAGNPAIVEAVSSGEIDVGLVNHYYVLQLKAQKPDLKAANHFFTAGDPGSLVNVAGAGILKTADNAAAARALVRFLLSQDAQSHFARKAFEYPVIDGVAADPELRPLDSISPPDIDLSKLSDLQGTLEMLREVGILQ